MSNSQLVSLCKENDLNHEQFFGTIVEDTKELETDGVEIWPGKKAVIKQETVSCQTVLLLFIFIFCEGP